MWANLGVPVPIFVVWEFLCQYESFKSNVYRHRLLCTLFTSWAVCANLGVGGKITFYLMTNFYTVFFLGGGSVYE